MTKELVIIVRVKKRSQGTAAKTSGQCSVVSASIGKFHSAKVDGVSHPNFSKFAFNSANEFTTISAPAFRKLSESNVVVSVTA